MLQRKLVLINIARTTASPAVEKSKIFTIVGLFMRNENVLLVIVVLKKNDNQTITSAMPIIMKD